MRAVEGLSVRPTSDRLRETLFNILAPQIEGSRFLDLCAGSGTVGIEALSRGANQVTFVERSRRASSAIRANLNSIGAASEATIINRDALSGLKQLECEPGRFDLVFFDPPYESEIYSQVMARLGLADVLSPEAVVVVEHRSKRPPATAYEKLKMFRAVTQGESSLAFYEVGDW